MARIYQTRDWSDQLSPSLQEFELLATGYSGSFSPFPFHGAMVKNGQLVFNPQFEWAGGGFVSNAADLANWSKELYHLQIISEENRQEMQKGVPAATGKDHLYGLGLQIRPGGSLGTSYGHSGWFPGYITLLSLLTPCGTVQDVFFQKR